jgi:hypothetical protein
MNWQPIDRGSWPVKTARIGSASTINRKISSGRKKKPLTI